MVGWIIISHRGLAKSQEQSMVEIIAPLGECCLQATAELIVFAISYERWMLMEVVTKHKLC